MKTKTKKPAQSPEALTPSEQFKLRWRKQRVPGICRLSNCLERTAGKMRYCGKHQAELTKVAAAKNVASYRAHLADGTIARRYVDKDGNPTDYAVTKAKNAIRLLRAGALAPLPKRGEEATTYLQKLAAKMES